MTDRYRKVTVGFITATVTSAFEAALFAFPLWIGFFLQPSVLEVGELTPMESVNAFVLAIFLIGLAVGVDRATYTDTNQRRDVIVAVRPFAADDIPGSVLLYTGWVGVVGAAGLGAGLATGFFGSALAMWAAAFVPKYYVDVFLIPGEVTNTEGDEQGGDDGNEESYVEQL